MKLQTLLALSLFFVPCAIVFGAAPDADVAAAFRTKYPQSTNLQLVAEAEYQGSQYFIVWGGTLPPDGSAPDSDGTDEAAIKKNADGSMAIINGDSFTVPAENYIESPELCQALNDSYVSHRTKILGGTAAMQQFLNEKTFMSFPEACAFKRAGFRLNPATQIFKRGFDNPYTTAGELFPTQE